MELRDRLAEFKNVKSYRKTVFNAAKAIISIVGSIPSAEKGTITLPHVYYTYVIVQLSKLDELADCKGCPTKGIIAS
jgi:hypothetical protein